jgi:hypothetical protein
LAFCAATVGLAALYACNRTSGGHGELDRVLLRAEQVLRIGSVDDSTSVMTAASAIVVGPDGSLYSAYPAESVIRIHDRNGMLRRQLGRAGRGPGEFSALRRIGIVGDTLWAIDLDNYRLTLFDLEGRYRSDRLIQALTEQPSHVVPETLLAGGIVLGIVSASAADVAEGKVTTTAYVRLRPDGTIVDTVAVLDVRNTRMQVSVEGTTVAYLPQPFSDADLLTVSHDAGAAFRVNRSIRSEGEIRVICVNASGDTVFARTFGIAERTVTAAAADSAARALATLLRAGPRMAAMTLDRAAALVRDQMYVPRLAPPVVALVAGRDGSLWMQHAQAVQDSTSWSIVSASGRALGTVRLPRRLTPMAVDQFHVWGVELDTIDVPFIVQYTVNTP